MSIGVLVPEEAYNTFSQLLHTCIFNNSAGDGASSSVCDLQYLHCINSQLSSHKCFTAWVLYRSSMQNGLDQLLVFSKQHAMGWIKNNICNCYIGMKELQYDVNIANTSQHPFEADVIATWGWYISYFEAAITMSLAHILPYRSKLNTELNLTTLLSLVIFSKFNISEFWCWSLTGLKTTDH